MARILVTGAGGQLGSELAAADCSAGTTIIGLSRNQLDITDGSAVAAALQMHQPDVLINCAAWTDVDGAETQPDAAFSVNATGPRVLARACAQCDVRMIHVSTDYVFDGRTPEPIDEDHPPAPLSIYGRSKLAGEREVLESADSHCIVRTSGLYGREGPNFVLTILRRAAAGAALRVVADQVTSPTSTADLSRALLRLAALHASGTFHVTNAGSTSWHGVAVEALAAAGVPTPVTATAMADVAYRAERPRSTVLDNRRWRDLGEAPLPHWRPALRRYVRSVQTAPAAAVSGR